MMFARSCETNDFMTAPMNAFEAGKPVLNVISSTDPFFSKANAWLGHAEAQGHCGAALAGQPHAGAAMTCSPMTALRGSTGMPFSRPSRRSSACCSRHPWSGVSCSCWCQRRVDASLPRAVAGVAKRRPGHGAPGCRHAQPRKHRGDARDLALVVVAAVDAILKTHGPSRLTLVRGRPALGPQRRPVFSRPVQQVFGA